MATTLVFHDKKGRRKEIALKPGISIVGRRTECDVRIPQINISRNHCRIVQRANKTIVQDLREDPGRREELRNEEVIQELLDHPTIRDILADEDLMDAIRRRDIQRIWGEEKIHDLLNDEEARELLFSDRVRDTIRDVSQRWEREEEREARGD